MLDFQTDRQENIQVPDKAALFDLVDEFAKAIAAVTGPEGAQIICITAGQSELISELADIVRNNDPGSAENKKFTVLERSSIADKELSAAWINVTGTLLSERVFKANDFISSERRNSKIRLDSLARQISHEMRALLYLPEDAKTVIDTERLTEDLNSDPVLVIEQEGQEKEVSLPDALRNYDSFLRCLENFDESYERSAFDNDIVPNFANVRQKFQNFEKELDRLRRKIPKDDLPMPEEKEAAFIIDKDLAEQPAMQQFLSGLAAP